MSLTFWHKQMASAAAAILRDVYGPNAAKKVARDFGVSIPAAKLWLAGRFPQARTLELKSAVDAELARIEQRNTEIRKQLGLEGRRGGNTQSGETRSGEAVGADGKDRQAVVGFRGAVKP
jgi:hypothetical protein